MAETLSTETRQSPKQFIWPYLDQFHAYQHRKLNKIPAPTHPWAGWFCWEGKCWNKNAKSVSGNGRIGIKCFTWNCRRGLILGGQPSEKFEDVKNFLEMDKLTC